MSDIGVIRLWHEDDGWGVIDSPQTPGGCWAHFSALAAATFWVPLPGEQVDFEYEVADQDGFAIRATRVWPRGSEPVDRAADSEAGFGRIDFD